MCNVNSFGGVLEENRFLQVGPAGSATTVEGGVGHLNSFSLNTLRPLLQPCTSSCFVSKVN